MQGFLEVFAFWGGIRYICGEHSVKDHYLHTNGKVFGGSSQFGGGGESPQIRPPGSPAMVSFIENVGLQFKLQFKANQYVTFKI